MISELLKALNGYEDGVKEKVEEHLKKLENIKDMSSRQLALNVMHCPGINDEIADKLGGKMDELSYLVRHTLAQTSNMSSRRTLACTLSSVCL